MNLVDKNAANRNVVDKNGLQAHVVQEISLSPNLDTWTLLHFSTGELVLVPTKSLVLGEDGQSHIASSVEDLLAQRGSIPIHMRFAEISDRNEKRDTLDTNFHSDEESFHVIPVVEERVKIQTRTRESGTVAIHKRVHERTEVVDQPLQSEEVEIERIPVNRVVEASIPPRYEGDTMVISLLEELLVVEKRLLLREEVHIKKLHKEVHDPKEVLLREEHIEIERKPASDEGLRHGEATQ